MACAAEADIEESEVVYLGLDPSGTTDLTALVMVSATDPARVRSFFWKPVDTLREHPFRDFGSGDHRYLEWRSRGDLFTNPGRAIDPDVIASFLAELHRSHNIRGLAYDRWRCDELLREFDRLPLLRTETKAAADLHGSRAEPPGTGYTYRKLAAKSRKYCVYIGR
jgi:phage terminase large subunit-like protein